MRMKAFENLLGAFYKPLKPINVAGAKLGNFLLGHFKVAVVIVRLPFLVEDAIERIQRDKIKVVLTLFTGECKQLIKHVWSCHYGRAAVEFESVDFVLVAATANLVTLIV